MRDARAALRQALEEAPASVRALARQAGVSEALLRAVRDGERRLTPETREAVVAALRTWGETCLSLAEELEAAPPSDGSDR